MKIIIFSIMALLPLLHFAQGVTGYWHINHLVGIAQENEYLLKAKDSVERHIYGNSIELKSDGTFISSYSARCGNDCFTSNSGTYTMVGDKHIRFFLKRVIVYGDCEDLDTWPNKELGLFYIQGDSNAIKLIKSNGNPVDDKLNAQYSDLIDSFDLLTRKISNLYFLPWKKAGSEKESEMVKAHLTHSNVLKTKDVRILFSKKIRSAFLVILIQVNGQYRYMVYDLWYKNMALFDPNNLPSK